jgi:hypothetical protein
MSSVSVSINQAPALSYQQVAVNGIIVHITEIEGSQAKDQGRSCGASFAFCLCWFSGRPIGGGIDAAVAALRGQNRSGLLLRIESAWSTWEAAVDVLLLRS